MTPLEADYEEVRTYLRHAYRAMQRFMAVSPDWTAQVEVEEEFRSLRGVCREFARCQYGLEVNRKRKRERGRPV